MRFGKLYEHLRLKALAISSSLKGTGTKFALEKKSDWTSLITSLPMTYIARHI